MYRGIADLELSSRLLDHVGSLAEEFNEAFFRRRKGVHVSRDAMQQSQPCINGESTNEHPGRIMGKFGEYRYVASNHTRFVTDDHTRFVTRHEQGPWGARISELRALAAA